MGQAVLMTHEIGSNKYVPYGFFANEDKEQLQLPETDAVEIAKFRNANRNYKVGRTGLYCSHSISD